MISQRQLAIAVILLMLVATPILAACGATATPTVVPTMAPAATTVPTAVPPTATKVPPSPTPVPPTATPQGPTVGGTLVLASAAEPASLDAQKISGAADVSFFGSTLIAKDPNTGQFVGYLAESWKTSEDGLTWDFTLKKGVTFHDGTAFTAQDYVWTFERALNPDTKSLGAKSALGTFSKAEALDDYTLRITLKSAYYPFLESLALAFLQPLSKEAVEKAGDSYGRSPVGVGPYRFKEWVTGSKIVYERNPDFGWAPSFAHKGPYYIQTIEYRVIPEYATVAAGIEAGEIDFYSSTLRTADLTRIQSTGKVQTFEALYNGASPYLCINVAKPPFDDVRVRQAFSLAVDRDNLIKAVAAGAAVPLYGPISASVSGYWPGVEQIGYHYDLAKAKDLMTQAGYKYGANGMLADKDGKSLALDLIVPIGAVKPGVAEAIQAQLKTFGVEIAIKQTEVASAMPALIQGDYNIALAGYNYGDFEVVSVFFHSGNIGALNLAQVNDPELDKLLNATRTTLDSAKRLQACADAQKYMVEKAYMIPLYAEKQYYTLNSKVKGAVWSKFAIGISALILNDAYISK